MRIVIHARDIGPSKSLIMVASEAMARGHRVTFIGNDELGDKNLFLPRPNVFLSAISSFQNQEEFDWGITAGTMKIPWLVFRDTFSVRRQAAQGKVGNAIAIVAAPNEIEDAKEFGYKDAVYLGGPPIWQEYPHLKSVGLPKEAKIGNEKIILVGGIKNALTTDTMLKSVVESMKKIGQEWCLIFRPHPNEFPETKDETRRQKIVSGIKTIDLSKNIDINNILGLADLSIHTSGATATIAAPYLRLPVIYYEDETVRQSMIVQTGSANWYPAESGACVKADPEEMLKAIEELLTIEGGFKLAEVQEKVFPIPKPGERAEKRIIDFIEELVEK